MVKAVTLFLIVMIILGIFGKLRMPRLPGIGRKKGIADARKCKRCGGYILGEGPCACETKR